MLLIFLILYKASLTNTETDLKPLKSVTCLSRRTIKSQVSLCNGIFPICIRQWTISAEAVFSLLSQYVISQNEIFVNSKLFWLTVVIEGLYLTIGGV